MGTGTEHSVCTVYIPYNIRKGSVDFNLRSVPQFCYTLFICFINVEVMDSLFYLYVGISLLVKVIYPGKRCKKVAAVSRN